MRKGKVLLFVIGITALLAFTVLAAHAATIGTGMLVD